MDVPLTVAAALEDRPVSGAVCLEAGAGYGNATAGLLAAGAARVYAVTNDPDHADAVRERVGGDDRTAVLRAGLREVPLATDAVDLVTAHGLFNVLPPAAAESVAAEVTRVAAPGAHLVVDDYEPLPADADVADLFAVENAATELAAGRPALTFYPASLLRRLLAGLGWEFDRERTLLDPVPWTESHLRAHADATRTAAATLSAESDESGAADLGASLSAEADRLAAAIGEESVGTMYSLAFRRPE